MVRSHYYDEFRQVCAVAFCYRVRTYYRFPSFGSTFLRRIRLFWQATQFIFAEEINDWTPECYNKASKLPAEMPDHLKEYIANEADSKDDTLWVSCEGYHPSDVEHVGNISYYPQPGFKAVYFPYKESSNYLSPIVAVKFSEPMKDLLITVKCRAWAKNIGTFTTETGRTDFQLMIGQMPRPKQ
ncbi:sodium/potassium-transporting ATPase subunit beta-2-like [Schistocerca cancellata]|uniref:sodium/potassium-transporting ATPase subunit beta-2-like n=1 Tax=Schistocerca cancellata TaxID=274614 RepID=UPI00211763B7|nr:sodium/potassium-transporting ATPase subunit beta-2-like [Schistocerca cancellata]